jgi:hypothetical protein
MASEATARRRRPGRPSKLTPESASRILAAVRCGCPNTIACRSAGIGESTLYQWLDFARDRPDSEYAEFAERLEEARDEGVAARLALIQKAAVKDWRAAAWLLERDVPDRFSMRFRVEHEASPTTVAEFFQRAAERHREIERANGTNGNPAALLPPPNGTHGGAR